MLIANKAAMIDIESLGNTPRAAITSIGAVLFDPMSDWIGDSFHSHVSIESCIKRGLTIDASTVLWWMAQSDDARRTLIAGQAEAPPIYVALSQLALFVPADYEVWCNGSSFDFAILRSAFDSLGMEMPWKFWQERDMRTLMKVSNAGKGDRSGIYHCALDDAIHQAREVQRVFAMVREAA